MVQNVTKHKSCKQEDDYTHLFNYEANEKLKRRYNEKFDQMLLRLSFHLIKQSEKMLPKVPFLPCDIFQMLQNPVELTANESHVFLPGSLVSWSISTWEFD